MAKRPGLKATGEHEWAGNAADSAPAAKVQTPKSRGRPRVKPTENYNSQNPRARIREVM